MQWVTVNMFELKLSFWGLIGCHVQIPSVAVQSATAAAVQNLTTAFSGQVMQALCLCFLRQCALLLVAGVAAAVCLPAAS